PATGRRGPRPNDHSAAREDALRRGASGRPALARAAGWAQLRHLLPRATDSRTQLARPHGHGCRPDDRFLRRPRARAGTTRRRPRRHLGHHRAAPDAVQATAAVGRRGGIRSGGRLTNAVAVEYDLSTL